MTHTEGINDNLTEPNKVKVSKEKILNVNTKQRFIQELEKNPGYLEKLSLERLKMVDEYYKELIEKAEKKLEKLKKQTKKKKLN